MGKFPILFGSYQWVTMGSILIGHWHWNAIESVYTSNCIAAAGK